MHLYPNNLKARPNLWLWHLQDVVIIGIMTLFSVLIYTQLNIIHFLVVSVVYALLSLRMDDMSILDFILHSCRFFITQTQTYTWQKGKNE